MSHLLKDASTGGQHGTVFLNAPLGGQRDVLQGEIHNGVHLGRDKQSTSLSFPEHPLMELWKMPGLTPLDRRGGPEDGGKGSKATEQAEKKTLQTSFTALLAQDKRECREPTLPPASRYSEDPFCGPTLCWTSC